MSPARELLSFPAGLTLAEMVATAIPDRADWEGLTLTVGGDIVPLSSWHLVRPKPGTRWQLALLPRGGGILRMVLIAAVVALSITATVMTGGVAGALLGAGISMGGMLAVNALIPPPQLAAAAAKNAGTNYSVTGASNSAALWAPVPRVLGRHRTTPPLACEAVTSIRGTTSKYLNFVVCWGVGPLQVDDIRIGDTPLDAFDDVQHEFEPGTPGVASALKLYPTTQHMAAFSAQLTKDIGWVTRTTPLGVDTASVELSMPSGMIGYGKKTGDRFHMVVDYEVEWSVSDANTWTHFPGGNPWTVDQKTETSIILALDITFAARGQYDVRVRRLTDDLDPEETSKRDAGYWTSLKATTNEPPVKRTGLCLSAFRIKGTAQLSGQITNLSGVPWSIAPDYDAGTGTWVTRPTANPASLFRMWCEGPGTRDVKRYDLPSLEAWHVFCAAQGFACNLIVEGERTWQDVTSVIFAAGRASWTYATGAYGAAIDQPRPSVGLYTPRNLTTFSAKHLWPIRPHGIRVPFFNEKQNWAADERLVFYDGYDETNATRYERFDLQGITDPDLVHRFGRYHLAAAKLQPERFECGADWEHVAHQRGDRVDIAHDVMLVSVGSGRVRAVESASSDATVPVLGVAAPRAARSAAPRESLLAPPIGPSAVAISLGRGASTAVLEASDFAQSAAPAGVSSTATVGTPHTSSATTSVSAPGVPSTTAVGTPQASAGRATFPVPGVPSTATVGTPGVRLSAIVTDEKFATSPGTRYGLRVRRADLTLDLFEVLPDSPLTDRLTVPPGISLQRAPDPDDLVTLGELGRETLDCVILTVRPGKDMSATLTLIPYNDAIYLADTETIPDWDPRVTWPAGTRSPVITAVRSDEVVLARDADGSIHLGIVVSLYDDGTRPLWDITHVEVSWAPSAGAGNVRIVSAPNDADEVALTGVEADVEYVIRARYRLLSGTTGPWSPPVLHTVVGASFPPPDVTGLFLAGDRIAWSYVEPPDFAGFRARYSTTSNTTWEGSLAISDGLYTTTFILLDEVPDDAVEVLVKGETTAGVQSLGVGRITTAGLDRPRTHVVFTDDLAARGWGLTGAGGPTTGTWVDASGTVGVWTDAAGVVGVWQAPGTTGLLGGEVATNPDGSTYLRAVDVTEWAEPPTAAWAAPGTAPWAGAEFATFEWDFQYTCPSDLRSTDRLRLLITSTGDIRSTFRWVNDIVSQYPDDEPVPDAILSWPDWVPFGSFTTGESVRPFVPWRNGLLPVAGEVINFHVFGLGGSAQPTITGCLIVVESAETVEGHAGAGLAPGGSLVPPFNSYRSVVWVTATLQEPTDAYKVSLLSSGRDGPVLAAYDLQQRSVAATANVILAGV